MSMQPSDAVQAGRLIHWGLQVKERPALHAEYKELLDRYQDRTDFRSLTNQFAEGLGLVILDWGDHGLVLGPSPDSVFALRGASFRSNRQDADDLREAEGAQRSLAEVETQLHAFRAAYPRGWFSEQDRLIEQHRLAKDSANGESEQFATDIANVKMINSGRRIPEEVLGPDELAAAWST